MAKVRNKPMRVCNNFREDLIRVGTERVNKGLMNIEDFTLLKMVELLTRTKGYKISLEELRTKPEGKTNE